LQPPELMAVLENGVSRAKRPPVRSAVTLCGYTANQLSYEVWKGTTQENVHVRMFVNEGGCICKGKIPRKRAVTEAKGNGARASVVHSPRNEECKMTAHQARHIREYTKFCHICTRFSVLSARNIPSVKATLNG
jgi:hypothetical protein